MSLPTDFPSCNVCASGRTSLGKHTCWRKETDSETNKEPSSVKQQHTTDNQPKGTGSVKDGGHQFEMKMAALIGLRGLQRGDNFELFSNIDGAGNFGDLVYTAGGRRYFLQLKHADNPDKKKLTKGYLVKLLQNCFKSYCAIKKGDTFKDIPIDNSEFIIYTNKELTRELLGHKRRQRTDDIFFKTFDKGEIFSFSPHDENKEIDIYTRLENSLKKSKEFRDLCVREIVTEFLNKLIIITGQKGQRELDEVIIEEIRMDDAANVNEMYETEILELKTRVETWCTETKDKMTATMFRNWLQKAKTKPCNSLVSSLFVSCTKKLARTGINFSDCEISRLQAELSNKRAVHLRSDALTLCSILLLDCLPQSNCIFVTLESLQSNKNMLLYAWLGGDWECLIVSCDSTVQESDISETCHKMSENIKPDLSSKRVIILTEISVQQVTGFDPIDHKFNFEQLSKESQEMVLDKKIDFQGCEVTMRSVLQRHGNVEHVLGPELVTDLITEETAVNIGGKLHVNTGYYVPRILERDIYLRLDILKGPDMRHHVFAVSGWSDEALSEFVPTGQTMKKFTYRYKAVVSDVDNDARIIILDSDDLETCYSMLCESLSVKSLHWFEFKKGNLVWIRSSGAIDNLLNYIDDEKTCLDKRIITEYMKNSTDGIKEESIWNLGERRVLVVAEPGMGKSSTTTHVALHTKQRDLTSWVVHINWNDHTRKLQDVNAATINLDTLVEFLCSAAFPDSKYADIKRSLLKQALQSSGNITVLMDGFDEISPTYADKAAVILNELTKSKVGRLWVTSRPVKKERLEKELSVTAYGMKKLSLASQEDMLSILWKHKAGQEVSKKPRMFKCIKIILLLLNHILHDDNFTGCPLYITMIATVYEMEVETWLFSEQWIGPNPSTDLVNLYEKFVESKLHIYLTEKQKADITNSSVLDEHEDSKQRLLINFEKCALVAILPPPMLESLHNKQIEDEIKPFLERVDKGKDKSGVVMNVVEGKPQFVHRTFAECFTARWFSKNFESNRSVLEHILFGPKYSFVRDMFDRMLAKDCPLHCAVLEFDLRIVETLLEEGFDANAVDRGGRTLLHIIPRHDWFHWEIRDLNCDKRVSFDKKDCVMQWTPLQYAIKRKTWRIVDELLKSNVDISGLDMIRQRAHDTDYTDAIIIESAKLGNLSLLEFICSIGVNIHQASSKGFPSPLHSAIKGKNLPVVKWLMKHGADCNTRYSEGQTSLFYAVTEGSLDVVRALVEEGGASLDVRDDCGRTAIDWANDYMADPKNHWILSREYRTENLKEIVNYLQERNCKVFSTAWQNNDS